MANTEKDRKLTAAEQRRLERFEKISAALTAEGYEKIELTVGIVKANLFAVAFAVPLCAAAVILFFLIHGFGAAGFSLGGPVAFLALFLLLIPVHELIHGAAWALFAERRFNDIEFGFMREYLTPYCTCKVPLTKGRYIVGALSPLVLLGIAPLLWGLFAGSFFWLWIGLAMTIAAGGDILIVLKVLSYHGGSSETLLFDHPTEAGCVVFRR